MKPVKIPDITSNICEERVLKKKKREKCKEWEDSNTREYGREKWETYNFNEYYASIGCLTKKKYSNGDIVYLF